MMNRVIEQTVTWRHKTTRKVSTVRYFVAAEDRFRGLSESQTTGLTQAEEDAIEDYRRACDEGVAEIVARPTRRRVE
jgi:hypothetical protein